MAGRAMTRGMSAIGGFFLTDADAKAGLDDDAGGGGGQQQMVLNPMQGGGVASEAPKPKRGNVLTPVGGRTSVAARLSLAARPRFKCTQSHILFGVTAAVGFVVVIVLAVSLMERAKGPRA